MHKILSLVTLSLCVIHSTGAGLRRWDVLGLWCYSCVSNQPGCGEVVDWRIHHAITCPRENDRCVKITERKGVDNLIIRDCLSNLEGLRRDIPADTYEGCRKAANLPNLAVYVENEIKELDIKREYYDATEYCFCEFDQWCNSGSRIGPAAGIVASVLLILNVWLRIL